MNKRKIIIIGAGPGGLTSAMLLAHRGYEVEVFEKMDRVGGRCSHLDVGPYRFDTGPTFLMMKYILDSVFEQVERQATDYLDFVRLDPMYRLYYADGKSLAVTDNHDQMKQNLATVFPGNEAGLAKFLDGEAKRFEVLSPCFEQDYSHLGKMFGRNIRRALPRIPIFKSVSDILKSYFKSPEAQIAFMFQTKYLGMSPWECPGAFGIIPYVEHKYGIWHVQGGLARICDAMAQVAREYGAKIHLNSAVDQVIVKNGSAKGVVLANQESLPADAVIVNADFGIAVNSLFPAESLKRYSKEKTAKKKFSCSTFMLYLGLDKKYDNLNHHNIVFAKDYHKNIDEIFSGQTVPAEPSFYVRDSSAVDPTVAPEGHSGLYVLVPVPNNKAGIDWAKEKESFREKVLDAMITRLNLPELRNHIVAEKIITPSDWENEHQVYLGATFNLAHNLGQMLWLRPHNEFDDIKNVFLTGGGTHPGSGLPTIIESGRISADLITKKYRFE